MYHFYGMQSIETERKKKGGGSVSRVLYPLSRTVVIHLGRGVAAAARRGQPAVGPPMGGPGGRPPLLGLAPDEACHAASVAGRAVSSYLAVSPLPAFAGGLLSVALSVAPPLRTGAPGRYPASCPSEPGLSSGRASPPRDDPIRRQREPIPPRSPRWTPSPLRPRPRPRLRPRPRSRRGRRGRRTRCRPRRRPRPHRTPGRRGCASSRDRN